MQGDRERLATVIWIFRRVVECSPIGIPEIGSGFAKRDDLKYFLKKVHDIDYVHLPELAPTKIMLDSYKKDHGDWNRYEREFLDLIEKRAIESKIPPEVIADGCLLCSEDKPHHCHRRLVAEYLRDHWGSVDVEHLV